MKSTRKRPRGFDLSLVAVLMFALSLVACTDNNGRGDPELPSQASAIEDEAAAKYQEKVKKRVSASVVSSFARE